MLARSKNEVVKQVGDIMQNQCGGAPSIARMARMGRKWLVLKCLLRALKCPLLVLQCRGASSDGYGSASNGPSRSAHVWCCRAPTPTMRMNGGGIVTFATGDQVIGGTGPMKIYRSCRCPVIRCKIRRTKRLRPLTNRHGGQLKALTVPLKMNALRAA